MKRKYPDIFKDGWFRKNPLNAEITEGNVEKIYEQLKEKVGTVLNGLSNAKELNRKNLDSGSNDVRIINDLNQAFGNCEACLKKLQEEKKKIEAVDEYITKRSTIVNERECSGFLFSKLVTDKVLADLIAFESLRNNYEEAYENISKAIEEFIQFRFAEHDADITAELTYNGHDSSLLSKYQYLSYVVCDLFKEMKLDPAYCCTFLKEILELSDDDLNKMCDFFASNDRYEAVQSLQNILSADVKKLGDKEYQAKVSKVFLGSKTADEIINGVRNLVWDELAKNIFRDISNSVLEYARLTKLSGKINKNISELKDIESKLNDIKDAYFAGNKNEDELRKEITSLKRKIDGVCSDIRNNDWELKQKYNGELESKQKSYDKLSEDIEQKRQEIESSMDLLKKVIGKESEKIENKDELIKAANEFLSKLPQENSNAEAVSKLAEQDGEYDKLINE